MTTAAILAALLAVTQPLVSGRPSTAPAVEGVSVEQKLGEKVPLDLGFTDDTGRSIALRELFGKKPIVLAMVYYECPMLCTLVLNGLVRALRAMTLDAGTDYDVVVVSIDPRETPALAAKKKQTYVRNYGREGTEKGWHFLVGKERETRALGDSVGFHYVYDESNHQYAHPAQITVLTPDGRVSRYLDGVEYSAKDLRFGLIESSEARIGTLVDRVMLLCFHYDPSRGKYGLVVMNVLRLGGGFTVLLLGSVIALLLRREKRKDEKGSA